MITPRQSTLGEEIFRDIDKNPYLNEIYNTLLVCYSKRDRKRATLDSPIIIQKLHKALLWFYDSDFQPLLPNIIDCLFRAAGQTVKKGNQQGGAIDHVPISFEHTLHPNIGIVYAPLSV